MEGGRAILFSLWWNIYKDKSVIVETCVNTGTDINTYSSVSKMFCATTGKLKENQALFFPASWSKMKRQHRKCKICNSGSPSTSAWREVVVTGFFHFSPLCRVTITKQWERKYTLQRVTDFFVYLQNTVTKLTPSFAAVIHSPLVFSLKIIALTLQSTVFPVTKKEEEQWHTAVRAKACECSTFKAVSSSHHLVWLLRCKYTKDKMHFPDKVMRFLCVSCRLFLQPCLHVMVPMTSLLLSL